MAFVLVTLLIAVVLLVGLVVVQEAGRRVGRLTLARDPEGGQVGLAAVESSIFALLGLLIAFSFNGAAGRFEQRRSLITQEANAISTAYLRLELLAEGPRASLQAKFRHYLEERLAAYAAMPDLERAQTLLDRSKVLQGEIWSEAVSASAAAGNPAPMLVLPPLNTMFDIATTRRVATQAHPPLAIFVMLGLMALLSGFPAGYAMARRATRPLLHMFIYAGMTVTAIYVTLDLEFPRLGFIRIDEADRILVDTLNDMQPPR